MTAQEIIGKVKDISAFPDAAVKLLNLLNQPGQHNDDVVRVIQVDPALTAKLLRECNSAFFANRSPVGSVEQAVLMLGHQEILRIVMAVCVGGPLSKGLEAYAVEEKQMWEHSLMTGLTVQNLILQQDDPDFDPALAFTAGLLHDIGKLAINQILTPELRDAIRELVEKNGHARVEAEKAVIGVDHAAVGEALLTKWRLPDPIIEAVANHHNPISSQAAHDQKRLSGYVHVGNCVAHLLGSAPGWDGFAVRAQENVVEALGIESISLERLMIALHDQNSSIQKFLKTK